MDENNERLRKCQTCKIELTTREFGKYYFLPDEFYYYKSCNSCYENLSKLETPILNNSLKKYGITFKDKVSMYRNQKEACAICKKHMDFFKLCVDHCHKTGQTRGLLCQHCNVALGFLLEDRMTCQRMVKYITKHERRYKRSLLP